MTQQSRGFFERLFDFSFSSFIATQIVGLIYGLALIVLGIVILITVIGSFARGPLLGIGALVVSPIFFLLYSIFIRIGLEAFVAAIRTAENTRKMVELMRNSAINQDSGGL